MNTNFDKWFKEYWGSPPKYDAELFTVADLKEAWIAALKTHNLGCDYHNNSVWSKVHGGHTDTPDCNCNTEKELPRCKHGVAGEDCFWCFPSVKITI